MPEWVLVELPLAAAAVAVAFVAGVGVGMVLARRTPPEVPPVRADKRCGSPDASDDEGNAAAEQA